MAKKRRRVHVITDVNFNGDTNEKMATIWNAECLADYFYMEKSVKDEVDLIYNPNDEYFRGNTCLEVEQHKKRVTNKNEYGRICWGWQIYETMIIHKMDINGNWFEVFTTTDMDEICSYMDDFNCYRSLNWNVLYDEFVRSI